MQMFVIFTVDFNINVFQESEVEFWKAKCQDLKGEVEERKEECRRLASRID